MVVFKQRKMEVQFELNSPKLWLEVVKSLPYKLLKDLESCDSEELSKDCGKL